jgi:hypothetical protein
MSASITEKIRQYYADNVDAYREKCRLFISALQEKPNVRRACAHAGLDRSTPYVWRANDPDFRQAWDSALEDNHDEVEGSLYDMAVSGKNVVATIFYLKNNRRAKYGDRVTVDFQDQQRIVEQRLDSLRAHQPEASTKDIIRKVLMSGSDPK